MDDNEPDRDRTTGTSSLQSDEMREEMETLHGGKPMPAGEDLELPSHDARSEPRGRRGITTLHGGEDEPRDDDLALPRHDTRPEAERQTGAS
ncbi:MAG: hypothetical protein NVS3B16_11200 [Vulcanimicrobiaceae bacterium]